MMPEKLSKPQTWTHPDTGDQVEIPTGATVHRAGDIVETMTGPVLLEPTDDAPAGTILYWHMPPEHEGDQLHADQVEGYEPRVPRTSVARRVLMHITDEQHAGRGPRNTLDRLVQELVEDPDTPISPLASTPPSQAVQEALGALTGAGLVAERGDGTLAVTDAGLVELRN